MRIWVMLYFNFSQEREEKGMRSPTKASCAQIIELGHQPFFMPQFLASSRGPYYAMNKEH